MSNIPINVRVNAYYEGVKTLDGNTYNLTFRWNTYTEKWYMDISGFTNDVAISGIALVCGKDLLGPHGYNELGGLWVIDNSDANEDPEYEEFGSRWTVEYVPIV